MATDMYTRVEVRGAAGRWEFVDLDWEPFDWRDYGMYGFLADVRNYSHVPVISEPRGLPEDLSAAVLDEHSKRHASLASWLTIAELQAFDYDQVFWNRRIAREVAPGRFDGAALAQEGEGEHLTVRAFLGEHFFADLDRLATLGPAEDVRVVFWFD